MSTATGNTKTVCSTCNKANAIFTCRGCSQDFCMRHATEHRQELEKQLDGQVIVEHDRLKQDLDEHINQIDSHPAMKEIDKWEEESIAKIRQMAATAKEELRTALHQHLAQVNSSLRHLAEQLKTARDDESFFETDINAWIKRLEELKIQTTKAPDINLQLDHAFTPLKSPLSVLNSQHRTEDWFDRVCGHIKISENGKLVTHQATVTYASVRGRQEYTRGQHHLRFQIEYLNDRKWLFIGIVSKETSATGYGSIGANTFGFSGENNVWCNGSHTTGLKGYQSNFEVNDVIDLLIDCDEQKIQLSNNRAASTYVLEIDVNTCPLPWKMTVGFYYAVGERVRLLN